MEKEEYKLVLRYRFLEYKSMSEIADIMFAGLRTVKRWSSDAINKLHLE